MGKIQVGEGDGSGVCVCVCVCTCMCLCVCYACTSGFSVSSLKTRSHSSPGICMENEDMSLFW